MDSLTDTQAKIYRYCKEFLKANDQLPTCALVSKHMGYASPNSAGEALLAMEKKGWFERNEAGNRMFKR